MHTQQHSFPTSVLDGLHAFDLLLTRHNNTTYDRAALPSPSPKEQVRGLTKEVYLLKAIGDVWSIYLHVHSHWDV